MLNSQMSVSKVQFKNKKDYNRQQQTCCCPERTFKKKTFFLSKTHFVNREMFQQGSNLKKCKKLVIGFPNNCLTKKKAALVKKAPFHFKVTLAALRQNKGLFLQKTLDFKYCKTLSLHNILKNKLLSLNLFFKGPRVKSFSMTASLYLLNSNNKKSFPENLFKKRSNSNSLFYCNKNLKYKNKLPISYLQSISCDDKNISPDWHFKPNILSSNNSTSLLIKEESFIKKKMKKPHFFFLSIKGGLIKNSFFKKKEANMDIIFSPALWFSSGYLSWSTLFSTRKYWWSRLPSAILMQRLTYKTFLIPYNFLTNKGSNLNKETENLNRNNLPEWLMEKQLYWYWVLPFFGCLGLSVLSSNQTVLHNDISFLNLKTFKKELETSNSFLKQDIFFDNLISWETLHYLDYKRSLFDTSQKYIKNINYYHDTLRVTLESRWFNQQKEEYNCTFSDQKFKKELIKPEIYYFDIWETSLKNLKISLLNELPSKNKLSLTFLKNATSNHLETSFLKNNNKSFSFFTKDTEQELKDISWLNIIRSQSSFYWYWHNLKTEPLFNFLNNNNLFFKKERNWLFMDEFAQKISPAYLFNVITRQSVAKTFFKRASKINNQTVLKSDIQIFNNILDDIYQRQQAWGHLKKTKSIFNNSCSKMSNPVSITPVSLFFKVGILKKGKKKTKFSLIESNKVITKSSFKKEPTFLRKLIGIYYPGKKYISNFIQNSQKHYDLKSKINTGGTLFNQKRAALIKKAPFQKEKKVVTSLKKRSFLLWNEWLNNNLKIYKSIGKEFPEIDFNLLNTLQNSRQDLKGPINSFQKAHVFYNNILNTLWLESNHNIYNFKKTSFIIIKRQQLATGDVKYGYPFNNDKMNVTTNNILPQTFFKGAFISSGHQFPEYDIYDLLKLQKVFKENNPLKNESIQTFSSNFLTNNHFYNRKRGFCQPFLKFNVINLTKMPPNALKLYAQDIQTAFIREYQNDSLIKELTSKDLSRNLYSSRIYFLSKRQSLVGPYTSLNFKKENFDLLLYKKMLFEIKNRIKKNNAVRSSFNQQSFLGGSLLTLNKTSKFVKKELSSFLIKKKTAVLRTPPILTSEKISFFKNVYFFEVLKKGKNDVTQVLNNLNKKAIKKSDHLLDFGLLFKKSSDPLLLKKNEKLPVKMKMGGPLKRSSNTPTSLLSSNIVLNLKKTYINNWSLFHKYFTNYYGTNALFNPVIIPEFELFHSQTLKIGPEKWLKKQKINFDLSLGQNLLLPQENIVFKKWHSKRKEGFFYKTINKMNFLSNKILQKPTLELLWEQRANSKLKGFQALQTTKYYQGKTARQNNNTQTNKNSENDNSNKAFNKIVRILLKRRRYRKIVSFDKLCHWLRDTLYFRKMTSQMKLSNTYFNRFSSRQNTLEHLSDSLFRKKDKINDKKVLNNNDITNTSLNYLVMNKKLYKKRKIKSFRPFYESLPSLVKKTTNVKNNKLLLSFSNELYTFAKQFKLRQSKSILNNNSNFSLTEKDYCTHLLHSKKLIPNNNFFYIRDERHLFRRPNKEGHIRNLDLINYYHTGQFINYKPITFHSFSQYDNKNFFLKSVTFKLKKGPLQKSSDSLSQNLKTVSKPKYKINSYISSFNLNVAENESYLFKLKEDYLNNKKDGKIMKEASYQNKNTANINFFLTNNSSSNKNDISHSFSSLIKHVVNIISNSSNDTYIFLNLILSKINNFISSVGASLNLKDKRVMPSTLITENMSNLTAKKDSSINVSLLNLFPNSKNNSLYQNYSLKTKNVFLNLKQKQNSFKKRSDFKIMQKLSFLQDLRKDTKWSNNIRQNWEKQINPNFLFLQNASLFHFKKDIKTATQHPFMIMDSLPLNNQNRSFLFRRWNLVVQNELTTPLLVQFKNLSSTLSIWRERFQISRDYTLLLNLVYFDHLGAVLNNIFKEFLLSNLSLLKEINGFKGSIHFNLQQKNTVIKEKGSIALENSLFFPIKKDSWENNDSHLIKKFGSLFNLKDSSFWYDLSLSKEKAFVSPNWSFKILNHLKLNHPSVYNQIKKINAEKTFIKTSLKSFLYDISIRQQAHLDSNSIIIIKDDIKLKGVLLSPETPNLGLIKNAHLNQNQSFTNIKASDLLINQSLINVPNYTQEKDLNLKEEKSLFYLRVHDLLRNFTKTISLKSSLRSNIAYNNLISDKELTNINLQTLSGELLSPNHVSLIDKGGHFKKVFYYRLVSRPFLRNKLNKSLFNFNDSAVLSKNFILKQRANNSKKLSLMKRQQKFLRILQMIKKTTFLYDNKIIRPLLTKLSETSAFFKADTFNIPYIIDQEFFKEKMASSYIKKDSFLLKSNKTKSLVSSLNNQSLENSQTEINTVKPYQQEITSAKNYTNYQERNFFRVKNTLKFRRKEGILMSRTPIKVKDATTAKTQKYSLCIKDLSSFLFFQNNTSGVAGTGFWMCAILFHICIVFSLITIYKSAFHFCIKCTFTLTTLLLKHFINLKRSFQRINKYVYHFLSIKMIIDAVNQNRIISKDKNIISKFKSYLTSFLLVQNKPLTVNKRDFVSGSNTGNLLLNLFFIKRNTNTRKTSSSFLNFSNNFINKSQSLQIFDSKKGLRFFVDLLIKKGHIIKVKHMPVSRPLKKEEGIVTKTLISFLTRQKKEQQNKSIKMNVKLLKLDFLILLLIGESQVLAELEPYREMHWYFLKKQPLIMRAPATKQDPINMYDYQSDEKIRKLKIRLRKSAEILSGRMDKTTKKYKSISEFFFDGPLLLSKTEDANPLLIKDKSNEKSLVNSHKEKQKKNLIKKMYSRALYPSLENNQFFEEVKAPKVKQVLRKNKRLQNLQIWKPLFSFFGKTLLISRLIKFNQTFRQSLFFFDQPLSIFGPIGTLFGPYLVKQFQITFDTNRNKRYSIDLFFKEKTKRTFNKITAGSNNSFNNLGLARFNSDFLKTNKFFEPLDSSKQLEKNGDWTQFLSRQILNRLSTSQKLRMFTAVPPVSLKKEDRDMSNHLSKLVIKYALIKQNSKNNSLNFIIKDVNSERLKSDNSKKNSFNIQRKNVSLDFFKIQQPHESTFLINPDFSSIYQINTENSVSNMFLTSDTYDPKTRFYRFFTNFNKKLRHVRGLSYEYDVHYQLGPLMCQIYSSMFLNKNNTLKNILLVGSQGRMDTSSMLVQAMAGETGFKLFMEDSKRLGRVGRRGINKSIQRLFKLFQIAQSNVPCIVYLEDIHVIASKRRLVLFKDEHDDEDLAMRALFSKLIYQKEHIKKSLTTSFINQNLFFGGETPNRKRALRPQNPIPKNLIQYQLNRRSAYSNYISQNGNNNVRIKLNTKIFVSKRLAPSFTTNAVLIWKMFKNKIATPRKRVKEAPWTHLPIDALRSIHPLTYSVKVKVAKLSLLAIYTMGTQLRLVKDLIRLFESLKYDSYQGFVVFATTNKLSLIDPSLRQPGRLEETVYLSSSLFSTSVIGRIDVLNTYAKKFTGFKNTFNIVNSAIMLSSFPFSNNGQNNNPNNSTLKTSSYSKDDEWNFVNSTAKKTYENTYLSNYLEFKPQVYLKSKMDVVLNSPSSFSNLSFLERSKIMSDQFQSSASQKQRIKKSVQKVLTLLNMSNQILSNISYRINSPFRNILNTPTFSTPEKKQINVSMNLNNFSNLSVITTCAYAQAGKFILSFVFEQIDNMRGPVKKDNCFKENKSFIYDIQNINGFNLWSFSLINDFKQSNKFLQRSKYLKTQLARFIAPKIGELFVFSLPKRENKRYGTSLPFLKTSTYSLLNNKPENSALKEHSRKSPKFFKKGFVNVQGLTANGKTTSSFLLSLMLTNNLSGKNTFLPRLFRFEDVLKQRERPFSENFNSAILYEYLNINVPSFLNKNTISLEENLQNQQQQKYLLNLEKRPLRKYNLLKTFIYDINNDVVLKDQSTSFQTNSLINNSEFKRNTSSSVFKIKSAPNFFHMLFNELSSLDEISGRPTSLIYSSGSYYYNRKIMLKQKINKFSYKWWNWHLKKPTEFLEEYQYLDSFPYADKHYNPRHRRWTLSNGYWGYWFTYEKMYSYEIYEQWMVESFHKLSNKLDNYRELMDFLAQVLITKQVLSEVLFINIMKRFL